MYFSGYYLIYSYILFTSSLNGLFYYIKLNDTYIKASWQAVIKGKLGLLYFNKSFI
jgi:hypothetical protein